VGRRAGFFIALFVLIPAGGSAALAATDPSVGLGIGAIPGAKKGYALMRFQGSNRAGSRPATVRIYLIDTTKYLRFTKVGSSPNRVSSVGPYWIRSAPGTRLFTVDVGLLPARRLPASVRICVRYKIVISAPSTSTASAYTRIINQGYCARGQKWHDIAERIGYPGYPGGTPG
jgi:hypothetical protein